MWTYVEIDGKLYVTEEDYLNVVKYYENSLSAERAGAKEDIEELKEENKELKKDKELLLSDYEWLLEDNRGLAKENMELINKVKLLEHDRDMYRNKYKEVETGLEQAEEDYRRLENEYLLIKNK